MDIDSVGPHVLDRDGRKHEARCSQINYQKTILRGHRSPASPVNDSVIGQVDHTFCRVDSPAQFFHIGRRVNTREIIFPRSKSIDLSSHRCSTLLYIRLTDD